MAALTTPKPTAHGAGSDVLVTPIDSSLPQGVVIAGKYRVLALIGDGSMGAVYRVENVETREVVALKLLHMDLSGHNEVIARFAREAIAAARIEHPNVVRAIDFGKTGDGSVYLVLEYVNGRELRSELAGRPMPVERALKIMRGVVAGTRAAHEKGIIHRDLKPENIMLVERDGDRDFVKLLDFGIARLEAGAGNPKSSTQPLTVVGTTLGTPGYMSPEQVLGGPIDARSDLYALGVIFFELLTGSCPFSGNVATLLQQHLTAKPPELPPKIAHANPDLARIVGVLLAKSAAQRFQTAAELAEALDKLSMPSAQRPAPRVPQALPMRASSAPTRQMDVIAPKAGRNRGRSRRVVPIAVGSGVALLLIIALLEGKRERSGAGPMDSSDHVTVAEPSAVAAPAAPSASSEASKGVSPKPRRKPSDGTHSAGTRRK
jgi:eukaryotic-like serine/threonine-protein kinase